MVIENRNDPNRREIISVYFSIALVSSLIVIMVSYGLFIGNRLSQKYPLLVGAAKEAKLETTEAHLWFEEIISGDKHIPINTIWKHLGQADWYLRVILEGGENPEGRFVPIERKLIGAGIKRSRDKISEFKKMTEKRYESRNDSGIGSELDQLSDHLFQEILTEISSVEGTLQELMIVDLDRFRMIQAVIIGASIIFSLINLFIFRRFQVRQTKSINDLAEIKNRLENQIAARLQSESELKSSERKYKRLFDFMINGLALHEIITDDQDQPVDYRYIEVNKSFEALTGLQAKTTIGKTVRELIPGIEEDPFDWIGKYGQVALAGKEMRVEQYAEPLNRWYNINAYSPQKGQFATIVEEITDRKQMELALKETNSSLEDLVYVTSHDLQAPLVSLEGYASELLADYEDKLDENGIYCLNRLKNNAERMHKLILNLLDISRLNTQKYPFESFDPGVSIEEISKDLAILIKNAGAKISTSHLPVLFGDRIRLEGVFRKLITNSLLYQAKKIEICFEDKVYRVKDDGYGIPADQLEKIFRPGERLKMIDVDGSGMGLTFCRKVITQHEGEIWAESEGIGKGSVFSFYIKTENR